MVKKLPSSPPLLFRKQISGSLSPRKRGKSELERLLRAKCPKKKKNDQVPDLAEGDKKEPTAKVPAAIVVRADKGKAVAEGSKASLKSRSSG